MNDWEVVDVEPGDGLAPPWLPRTIGFGFDELPSSEVLPVFSPSAPDASALTAVASRCVHCEFRRKAMTESEATQCRAAAQMWSKNWDPSSSFCFGACLCEEFCVDHGFPAGRCPSADRHRLVQYRGTWVTPRKPVPIPAATAAAAAAKAEAFVGETPPEQDALASKRRREDTGCAVAGECLRRLKKLANTSWVRKDPSLSAKSAAFITAAATTCQGFCWASHVCKLHLIPAPVRKDSDRRFQCSVAHENVVRGRYNEDFAFFCSDDACCGGKWYSREESHTRAKKVHAPAAMASESPLSMAVRQVEGQEMAAREPPKKAAAAEMTDEGTQTWYWRRDRAMRRRSICLAVAAGTCIMLLISLSAIWILASPTVHRGSICWFIGDATRRCSECYVWRSNASIACNAGEPISLVGNLDGRTFSTLSAFTFDALGTTLRGNETTDFPFFMSGSQNSTFWAASVTMNHTSIFSRWIGTWHVKF